MARGGDFQGNTFHAFFVDFELVKLLLPCLIQALRCFGRGFRDYTVQVLDEQHLAPPGDRVSELLIFLVMRVIHHPLHLPKVFQHFERGDAHAAVFPDDLVAPGVVSEAGQCTNRLMMATALALN
jgi:hypothetical protein